MLDRAGDPEGDVELRVDRFARLSDLVVARQPAGVDGDAAAAEDAAEDVREFLTEGDALFDIGADTAADGNDNVRAEKVDDLPCGLYDLEDAGLEVGVFEREGRVQDLYRGGPGLVEGSLLHDARTHRRHGRTEARADDGGHQVTAEGRTGHLEVPVKLLAQLVLSDTLFVKCGVFPQEFDICPHIHVEMGAIGAQAGVQARGNARCQVAADVRRAEEHDFWLVFRHEVAHELRVRFGDIVHQKRMVADIDLISTVPAKLRHEVVHIGAQQHAAELGAQLVRQLASFADELEIRAHDLSLALLTVHPHAVELFGVRIDKIHLLHVGGLLTGCASRSGGR